MKGASGSGAEPKCCFESRGANPVGASLGDSPHCFTVFTKTMKDFFVSYNKADKRWAMWITQTLERAGYTVTAQFKDFRPGNNFVLEMQQATVDCKRTIAVLSDSYLKSTFTQPEWAAAFAQDPQGKKRTLIPVRVKKCDLEGLLPQIIYADLVDLDVTMATQELLEAVSDNPGSATVDFPGNPQSTPSPTANDVSVPKFPKALSEAQKIKESGLIQQRDALIKTAENLYKDIICSDSYSKKGIFEQRLKYVLEDIDKITMALDELGM
jgi:hypothetical protein